jgi:hypothetical protein
MAMAHACAVLDDDDWRELLSHEEVFRPLPVVRHGPQWILYRDATAQLKGLCMEGPFLDVTRFAQAGAALAEAVLLEAVKGGLLNELGKVIPIVGQELASDQVHTRAHLGWLRTEWPAESEERGDYVLGRKEFEEFVQAYWSGQTSCNGIIVIDADAAPAVRFLAVQERLHRENPTRRYQQSWGPRLHKDYSAQHPNAPIPQSAGPAMAAMIKSRS